VSPPFGGLGIAKALMTNTRLHDQFCIFTHRWVAICAVMLFLAAGVSGVIRLITRDFTVIGGTRIVTGLVAALLVLLVIVAKAQCWTERVLVVLLITVVLLKLAAVTIFTATPTNWIQAFWATAVYFASAFVVSAALVLKHRSPR
jgi:hypothetical protein